MKKTVLWLLAAVFTVTLVYSGWTLYSYFREAKRSDDLYDSLAQLVEQSRQETQTPPTAPQQNETTPAEPTEAPEAPLPDYTPLLRINPDLVGWLRVPDTKINYPVLQTPEDPDYYLHRDFEGREAAAGALYVQADCDVTKPSDNVIIYGHNMKNGSMFGELEKYEDRAFWETHPTFTFDTLTRRQTFEIVTVFKTFVYSDSADAFKYYRFVEAEDEEAFDAFLADSRERALYDTGVEAHYGDKLLTLSTCEYSRENGRLVVVAKLVEK